MAMLPGCAPTADESEEQAGRVYQPTSDIRIVPELTIVGRETVRDERSQFRRAAERRAEQRGIVAAWAGSLDASRELGRKDAGPERAMAVILPVSPETLAEARKAHDQGLPLFVVGSEGQDLPATCRLERISAGDTADDAQSAARLVDLVADYVRGLDVPRVIKGPSL